ncbi:MAG: hypothetical protein ABI221_00690 [Candidatus Saccharimonadales bacterium]
MSLVNKQFRTVLGKLFAAALFAMLLCGSCVGVASASSLPTSNLAKGLAISPPTASVKVSSGQQNTGQLTVTNNTPGALHINMLVKQFSVESYTYNYRFSPPHNNYIQFKNGDFSLAPGKSQVVIYNINVPAGSPPGGVYFMFLASTNLTHGNLQTTAQAGTLLYLTVNGKLSTSSQLLKSSISRFSFGSSINYRFDVLDTGNVYFFISPFGSLGSSWSQNQTAHIVMPGAARQITGSINHPLLPGLYKANFGYKTSTGQTISKTERVFYVPPWFIAAVLILLLAGNTLYMRKRKR